MFKWGSALLMVLIFWSCNQRPKRNIAFYKNIGGEPSRLNPIGSSDGYTFAVRDFVYETLMTKTEDSLDWYPMLATRWEISEDKSKFIFHLRPGVVWSDGTAFTAEDVKFSFDILFQDKFNTVSTRSFFEGIEKVNIINPLTVEFIAKDNNYKNFDVIGDDLRIFPKHFYSQDKKKSFFNKNLLGTGPYKLDYYARGSRIVLVKNPLWWGYKIEGQKKHNFEKVVLRFVSDKNVSLEMFKKGALDLIGMNPDIYNKRAVGPEWGKTVHKVKTQNSDKKGVAFIGWNMDHPILKSLTVRKALYHLINRELMNEKFNYGDYYLAAGPVYHESDYHNQDIPIIKFNPKEALKLLRSDGWKDTDGDNILDKVINGKKTKFSITILEPWEGFIKYLTIFKEDAKQVGVEINIKQIEWNSFVKLLDERNFEAVRLAWGGTFDWDPTQIWHSKSIADGGSNFVGFRSKEVDRLTDLGQFEHDRAKRIALFKKVEKLIVEQYPYAWFFYSNNIYYGYSDRIQRPKDTFTYDVGTTFWKFKDQMRKDI